MSENPIIERVIVYSSYTPAQKRATRKYMANLKEKNPEQWEKARKQNLINSRKFAEKVKANLTEEQRLARNEKVKQKYHEMKRRQEEAKFEQMMKEKFEDQKENENETVKISL